MDAIIELKNVTFEYAADEGETPRPVMQELNLSFARGSFNAVLGHNGSGKSTLAKLLNGLNRPTGGQVLVNGIDTADEKREFEVRKTVGMVFQNPDNQLVATVVEEDVAFGPENLGVEPAEIRRRVDEALRAVGMYDYRTHAPHKLSGGQKQRVAIAGILAMEPACIVLDEPTAMLDPQGRREVMETIRRLNRERGITVILITHYMDEAAQADRVVVMDEGKILLDGGPREVFREVELLKSVGLDVPQPAELLYELRRAGIPVAGEALSVPECVDTLAAALGLPG